MTEMILTDEEVAEANLHLAKRYVHMASASMNKEEKVKNMIIARNTLNKCLSLCGIKN